MDMRTRTGCGRSRRRARPEYPPCLAPPAVYGTQTPKSVNHVVRITDSACPKRQGTTEKSRKRGQGAYVFFPGLNAFSGASCPSAAILHRARPFSLRSLLLSSSSRISLLSTRTPLCFSRSPCPRSQLQLLPPTHAHTPRRTLSISPSTMTTRALTTLSEWPNGHAPCRARSTPLLRPQVTIRLSPATSLLPGSLRLCLSLPLHRTRHRAYRLAPRLSTNLKHLLTIRVLVDRSRTPFDRPCSKVRRLPMRSSSPGRRRSPP